MLLPLHSFSAGANTVRPGGCFYRRESVYPIHIAAKQGDYELVKILLEVGIFLGIGWECHTPKDEILTSFFL